jgi:hypothetical protein
MSEKILTLHPEGKEGVNIDKAKYDAVREAVLAAIRAQGDMPFGSLADAVGQRLPDFDGSIGWYTTTVKLDLEARGEIERLPGNGPQRLRLK